MRNRTAVAETTATPRPALDGLTILVADDHRDTVDLFRAYLAACGATAVGATSARAALALSQAVAFDAALIDLRMPGEDGRWFLRQLRASATESANARVFAVSGEDHEEPEQDGGFAAYFLKPVGLDVLVATLAALPRRRCS